MVWKLEDGIFSYCGVMNPYRNNRVTLGPTLQFPGRVSCVQALMGGCAQPRLAPRWRKAALSALADAAERGANASDAWQQAMGFWGVSEDL